MRIRTGQIEEIIFRLEVDDKALFKDVVELLKEIGDGESIRYRFVTDAISFLVKNNVLFVDPTTKVVRPQSKLDLLAVKRVLEEVVAN